MVRFLRLFRARASLSLVLAAGLSIALPSRGVAQQGATAKSVREGAPRTDRKPAGSKTPSTSAGKAGAVVTATRVLLRQILAGKVDAARLTPGLRARLTSAKVRSLGASLRAFGPLNRVTLVDRKEGDVADVCTLRIHLGETVFIGTVRVTKDNLIDDLKLLEE